VNMTATAGIAKRPLKRSPSQGLSGVKLGTPEFGSLPPKLH
jgi:hypothetical protein